MKFVIGPKLKDTIWGPWDGYNSFVVCTDKQLRDSFPQVHGVENLVGIEYLEKRWPVAVASAVLRGDGLIEIE